MYTVFDFKTKKALKEAVNSGEIVKVYQPGGMFGCQQEGSGCVEGPHYPKPHTWYATVNLKHGIIMSVR